jgi:hypothetical protein
MKNIRKKKKKKKKKEHALKKSIFTSVGILRV